MSISIENLELSSSRKSGSNPHELLIHSIIIENLKTGVIETITEYSLLPNANTNQGKIYLVENENVLYWSNGEYWEPMRRFFQDIWSWGNNTNGQLGDGTILCRSSPVSISNANTNWCKVFVGSSHSASINRDETLWSWGYNNYGQLGDDTVVNKSFPITTVGGKGEWDKISLGEDYSLGIRLDNSLWAWGYNNYGQLGDNTVTSRRVPVTVVPGSNDWCDISAGQNHSLAIKTDGTLWSWGYNLYGKLGDGTTTSKRSPITVSGGGTDWCQISAGENHSLALKTDGTLWTWGYNICGQLGDGTTTSKNSPDTTILGGNTWCQISSGRDHSLALKTDGTLWTWGKNNCGQLGDNTVVDRSTPITTILGGTDWCAISAGGNYSLAIKTDGTLWSWGDNIYGQLGNGTVVTRSSPGTTVLSVNEWCDIKTGSTSNHVLAIRVRR